MALSKKDYVALAKILLDSRYIHPMEEFDAGINQGVFSVEMRLIEYLTLDNPRFDVVRFREASNFKVGGG